MKLPANLTPGPWHQGVRPSSIIYGPQGEQIANLREPLIPEVENKANNKAIASLPALMASMIRLLNCPDLNLDSLEPETVAAFEQAQSTLLAAGCQE
jgi:hypothetical protein